MSIVLNLLKQLLSSKKFIVTVSGFIVTLLAKLKFNIDPTTMVALVTMIVGYLLSQGWADAGKEAAKIEAVSNASLSIPKTPEADKAIETLAEGVKAGG